MIILLSTALTILMGLLVWVEVKIDHKIVNNPARFSALFIKLKHSIYSTPRYIVLGAVLLQYFNKYPRWEAVGLIALNGTACACLFRAWHDSLYQHVIYKLYGKGDGFFGDSQTPVKLENSFWDKHLRDTAGNRLACLALYFELMTIVAYIQYN